MKDFLGRLAIDYELYPDHFCMMKHPEWSSEFDKLKENPEIPVSEEDMCYYRDNYTCEDFISRIALYSFEKYRYLISSAVGWVSLKFGMSPEEIYSKFSEKYLTTAN